MDIVVSSESPIPLYLQLLNEIRHRILSGEWPAGSSIPSEHSLEREAQISRNTVRQALLAARAEGLLETVPGKGTFVSQRPGRRNGLRLIGYVVPYFRSSFDSQLIRGAESALRPHNYRIVFSTSDGRLSDEDRTLRLLTQDGVAGILIWPVMADDPHRFLADLIRQGLPVGLMDRTFPGLETDVVMCDNFGGGYLATQHLISLGHRRIAFLCRPHMALMPVAGRLRGYREAMRDAGLAAPEPLLVGERQEIRTDYALRAYTDASGADIEQLRNYLASPARATALFAMNDLMAMQALRAAEMEGIAVPGELSVAGFDDLDFVSHLRVPLTTVAQDPFALGHEAARRLLERVEDPKRKPQQLVLATRLVVRASTAPLAR